MPWFEDERFSVARVLALTTLFTVGASRAFVTNRGWLISGLKMLLVGALAAGVAYVVGAFGAALVG